MLDISRAGSDASGVTVVTLNHGKVSALDLDLCAALTSTFRDFTSGAVVLTGTGNVFSAGVDLWKVLDGGPAYVRALSRKRFRVPRSSPRACPPTPSASPSANGPAGYPAHAI